MEQQDKDKDKKQADDRGMEKRNVVERDRTPAEEERQPDDQLTKQATELFDPKKKD